MPLTHNIMAIDTSVLLVSHWHVKDYLKIIVINLVYHPFREDMVYQVALFYALLT